VKAVVLVGGEGTRLRPLTSTTPKQMLPIGGRPMIEHVLEHLASHGVDQVVLSLGYRPDRFLEAYPDGRCGDVALVYAVESTPLDTAGAVAFAARRAAIDEPFVVVNGDVLTRLDVSDLCAFHRARRALATIALTPVEDPSRYGVVATDGDGRVLAFVEKPPVGQAPSNLINAGTYVFEPEVLDRIPPERRVSMERETFPGLAAEGRLFAMASDADWLDAGTAATYLEANLAAARRRLAGIDPTARIDPGAVVRRIVAGPGVVVGAGAVVEDSVLLERAHVGADAVVRQSIVGRGARIGEGATVEELSLLGEGALVAPGARLRGARVPEPLG
jgi:mannose-1-phosphate guanylyltransferase